MISLPVRLVRAVRVVAVALAIACMLTMTLLLPLWAFVIEPHQRADRDERLAALPDAAFIAGRTLPAGAGARLDAELDALVELDLANPLPRLLRAGSRLARGDRPGATADLAAVAALEPSPYADAVAARYAAATAAPELADLPAPATPVDHLLAGFAALRAGDCAGAVQLLAAAEKFAPARQLQLVAAMAQEPPDPALLTATATWLEQNSGHATSRTRHAQGRALLLQQQFAAAAKLCDESLQLRPDQVEVLRDLAAAELGLGDAPAAERHLQRALQLQPGRADCQALLQQARAGR